MTSFFKRSFRFPVWYYCKATSSPEISLDFSGISGYCKYPRGIPEYCQYQHHYWIAMTSLSVANNMAWPIDQQLECIGKNAQSHHDFHTRPQCGMLLAEVTQLSSWAQHGLISRHCSSPIPKHLCTSTGGLLRSQQSAFSILHSECPE